MDIAGGRLRRTVPVVVVLSSSSSCRIGSYRRGRAGVSVGEVSEERLDARRFGELLFSDILKSSMIPKRILGVGEASWQVW